MGEKVFWICNIKQWINTIKKNYIYVSNIIKIKVKLFLNKQILHILIFQYDKSFNWI